eukprot:CAMPEP_0194260714 /NCGR_PEP_ID=MMETSP0158-20130606/45652_1 /TAXON_ID=33649 /ORGANISM="Thalassionema nitzschioides, Strain L26-B" /LENGTH=843 /DNA_ID=CAMNT_0039000811 /DNA_START=37 /DNA_END=2574 /DNA_ORIENTATION=-
MTLSRYYFLAASFLPTLANAENPEMDFGSNVAFGKTSTLGATLDLGTEPTQSNLRTAVDEGEEIIETNLPLVNAKIYEMGFGSVGVGEASTLGTNLDLGTKPTQSNLRTVLNPGEEIIETELIDNSKFNSKTVHKKVQFEIITKSIMTLSHYYFVAASCLTTLVNAENPEMDFGSDVGFGKTSTLGTNLDLGTEPTHRNLHSAVDAEEEIVEANLPLVNAKIYEMDFGSEVGFGEASTLRTNLDLGTKPTQSNLRTVLNPGEEIIETELPLHRYLQQGSTLEIWNTCDHDAYVYVIFRRGQSLFQWKWPRINMDESLSIEGVEGSSFWIYGVDGDDYSIPVWFSSDSEYCFSVGDCFREVNIDAGQDMINYLTCGAEASVPDPSRPPTLPPTQFPTPPPTLAPQGTRPPTRFPTIPPTQDPTRIPTEAAVPTLTPGIAAAPPRPANSIQQQWLDEHNSRRQEFYDLFPEYNLSPAPLKWSDSIAQSAQNYANQLIALNGCSIQHGLNNDNYGGENLASNWGSGSYAVDEVVWFSSDSEYCFSVGDCFREVNIDAGQDMINYLTCGAEASVPDPTRPPTLPPTQAAQQWPTRFPTRPPTLAPEGSRPPTRFPTRFPTRAPTRIPTQVTVPTQTPGIAAAPPRPANSIQQQWLNEHNSRRQAFYDLFPEYNLSPAPLKWSNSIAQSAQNYANQLIALNGCSIQHGLNDDNYGGENLASNWGSGSYAVARSPTQVLRAWYDDEIDLNRMQLKGQKYHATQAIWRSSRYLGCAQASKSTGGSAMCFIQVCRYIKPGNCLFTGSSSLYPDNCLQRYPSERNWICSVLSDTVSNSCASANEQCPAEGCF